MAIFELQRKKGNKVNQSIYPVVTEPENVVKWTIVNRVNLKHMLQSRWSQLYLGTGGIIADPGRLGNGGGAYPPLA